MSLFTKVELSTIDLCSNAVELLINMSLFMMAKGVQSVINRILKKAVKRNEAFPKYLRVQAI